MIELKFEVTGSSGDIYYVDFAKGEGNALSAYCNCRAGEIGDPCKHRLDILKGSTANVASDNIPDVSTVAEWYKGSDIQTSIQDQQAENEKADIIISKAKAEAKEIKKNARRNVGKAMND